MLQMDVPILQLEVISGDQRGGPLKKIGVFEHGMVSMDAPLIVCRLNVFTSTAFF
jgi:hypothetical protein